MTLDPELVISGSVTDAVTGKPVPRFRVIQGLDQPRRKGSSGQGASRGGAWARWNTPAVVTR